MPNQSITVESKADLVEKYRPDLPEGTFFTQTVTADSTGKNYNPAIYDYIINNIDVSDGDLEALPGDVQQPTQNLVIPGGLGGVIAPEATDGDTSEAQERVNFIYEATLNQNEESSSDENSEDKKESKGLLDSIGVTKKQAAIGSAALLTGVTILSSGD